ncbi:unnamed protein product [Sympodiomycopsis kandeliae]
MLRAYTTTRRLRASTKSPAIPTGEFRETEILSRRNLQRGSNCNFSGSEGSVKPSSSVLALRSSKCGASRTEASKRLSEVTTDGSNARVRKRHEKETLRASIANKRLSGHDEVMNLREPVI